MSFTLLGHWYYNFFQTLSIVLYTIYNLYNTFPQASSQKMTMSILQNGWLLLKAIMPII